MKKLLAVLVLPILTFYHSSNAYNTDFLIKDVSEAYLRSFPADKPEYFEIKKQDKFDVKKMRPPKLSDCAVRDVAFNTIIVKSSAIKADFAKLNVVLNKYAWSDLKFFYGSRSNPRNSLLFNVKRTYTLIGEAVLSIYLSAPLTSKEDIIKRQNIIKYLYSNDSDREYISEKLKKFSSGENSMLSLYTKGDPLYTKDYKDYMQNYYYAEYGTPSNKSAFVLELKKRFFRDFYGVTLRFVYPFVTRLFISIFLPRRELNKHFLPQIDWLDSTQLERLKSVHYESYEFYIDYKDLTYRSFLWICAIPLYGGIWQYRFVDRASKLQSLSNGPKVDANVKYLPLLYEVFWIISAYSGVMNYIEYSSTLKSLASRMSDLQLFLKTIQEINLRVKANPDLEKIYSPKLVKIRELLSNYDENTDLGVLITNLLDLPLLNWSYFFNNAGRLLASFILFVDNSEAFVEAMCELGEVDAFISVANFMKEVNSKQLENKICFVKYLNKEERSKPYIYINSMWNVFIDPSIAISNDVLMGDKVRNITLTGPNAGGKSTFLTGVANALVLAQTFGIAPAKEMIITPFSKINTYIDIADDIAAGNSLFMAEVKRAQDHISIIRSLKKNEFSFTIFDEPFSGTNAIEGAAAEYSILEYLADYENSLTIVATHYPIVMLLESRASEKGFANYKVFITDGEDKKLKYHYKIVPGKSDQAIAIRILEEEGFDTELLSVAKDILKNPLKYNNKF